MLNVPPRSEIPAESTWNAPSVFPSRADWKAAYEQLSAELPSVLTRYQGHLDDGPVALADWFDALGVIYERAGKILFYALMSQACDTTDQEANSMAGQATGLMGRFQAAASFAEPELLEMGEAKLRHPITLLRMAYGLPD